MLVPARRGAKEVVSDVAGLAAEGDGVERGGVLGIARRSSLCPRYSRKGRGGLARAILMTHPHRDSAAPRRRMMADFWSASRALGELAWRCIVAWWRLSCQSGLPLRMMERTLMPS